MYVPLRFQYLLYLLLIHTAIGILSFHVFVEERFWFLLSESVILVSLYIGVTYYLRFTRPFQFLYSGQDALQDQDFSIKFNMTSSMEMNKLIRIYNRMIDNIRAERVQVQEQHFFLQKLITASPSGILILDYDNRLSEWNPSARKMLKGDPNWIGKPLTQLEHPLLRQIHKLKVGETQVIRMGGTERFKVEAADFIHRGFDRRFIILQELSKEILQAEKEAYGKVIRMMVHEVNNSIGAVNSILESGSEMVLEKDLKVALLVAKDRNDRLNRFMKNFAQVVRLPEPDKKVQDLTIILKDLARFIRPRVERSGIQLVTNIPKEPISGIVDRRLFEQVLVNIIQNALEATCPGDCLKIQLNNKGIEIANNGAPIPEEVQGELFSPFFTTKPDGQGIGLTLVREILVKHGFSFSLSTFSDGWTRFQLLFT